MKSRKTFLGFRVPREVEKFLGRYLEPLVGEPLRFTKPENFHITLLFLGFCVDEDIAHIAGALGPIAEETEAFDLSFDRIEFLPGAKGGEGETLAALGAESADMLALYNRVRARLGIESSPAHHFRPHITLGRVRETKRARLSAPAAFERRKTFSVPVSTLVLFESVFTKGDGLRYETLEEFPLEGDSMSNPARIATRSVADGEQ